MFPYPPLARLCERNFIEFLWEGLGVSKLRPMALLAVTSLLLGCGGGDTAGPAPAAIATPTPTPSPSPTPTPTQTPSGSIVGTNMEAGFPQLEKIPRNFSMEGLLRPSWGTGQIAEVGEVVGAFRFLCKPTHLAYDDPIVFPGQIGRSHLHMFFGNTLADANSTYDSLRTTGESSCNNKLNRSAYWMPALLDGRGQVVMPEYVSIYYKRFPAKDPKCAEGKGCIGLPRGLRYVFGRTMQGELPPIANGSYFNCDGPGATPGHYKTLVEAAQNCPSGANIGAVLNAPSCWNGRELDSADHRSHMAYEQQDGFGNARCPATHPYRIPTFQLAAWYKTDDTLDRSGDPSPTLQTWHFASDRMPGMTPMTSGMTLHADWFGAWDDDILATWLDNCVDLLLSCSGGDLGNGTQLSYSEEFLREFPRRVAVPKTPNP